ncbi:hypothetical protein Acsp06_24240 [Actinomycetospora sp. NBRC 106375]|nr:hypothetical protein Acsp06_24240 [Actinomycetospora sp. NBRC 106375]
MWEEFLRNEGRPGRAPGPWLPAMNTRAGSPTLDRLKKAIGPGQDSREGTLVASVAFFLPSPLMFGYYVFHLLSTGAFSVWPMFLVVTALLTWLYASLHVWRTTGWISDIDEMIMGYVGMKSSRPSGDNARPYPLVASVASHTAGYTPRGEPEQGGAPARR